MATETTAPLEIRVDGRTLTGAAITYGDISPGHLELFEPGAFGPAVASLPDRS